jgi:hypothetical protein
MKKIFFSLIVFSILTSHVSILNAQNNIGIGTITPNAKSLLDLSANDKGFLVPRLTSAERIAINPTGNVDAALLVYDTNDNLFYFWNSAQWIAFPQQGGSNNISLNFDANTGTLSLTDNGGTLTTNIPPDNDSDPTNELITNVVFGTGNVLTIEEGGNTWSTTINVNDADSDPTNEIQQLTLNNNILNLSLSNNNINLAPYLDNTDNQTLALNGNFLSISNGNNVDLSSFAGDWKLLGNAGTNPVSNFLGTTDNQDLVLRTNNTERLRILGNNGFVGIGTNSPLVNLEVNGSAMINIAGATDGGRLIWRGGTGGTQEYRARVNTAGYLGFFPVEFGNPGYVGDVLSLTQAGDVGIGITTPTERLQVNGNVRIDGSFLQVNGDYAFFGMTANNRGMLIETVNASVSTIRGENDIRFNIGDGIYPGTTWPEIMRIRRGGGVGIGTPNPDQLLTVNGNASKPGGGAWATFSDKRVKKDIVRFEDGLNILLQLNPISFQYNELSGYIDYDKKHIGFIAQEVELIAPYMVEKYNDTEGASGLADKRQFDESALTKILVNAIQEQQAQIESLKAEKVRITAEIKKLNTEMEWIKDSLLKAAK